MGSQRGAEEYEYNGQQRSRKREAEEEGDNRRLCWAGSRQLALSATGSNATKEGESGLQHTVILDPTDVGFDLADWANWTRFRVVGPFEDVGEGVEPPED